MKINLNLYKLLILFLFLISYCYPSFTQSDYRIYRGSPLAFQIRDAFKAHRNLVESRAIKGNAINTARNDYFQSIKDGKKSEEKEKLFFAYLFSKDILIHQSQSFSLSLTGGQDSNLFDVVGGEIDNGIHPKCQEAFKRWSNKFGAALVKVTKENKFSTQEIALEALSRTSDYYTSYVAIRNWFEFEQQGLNDAKSRKQFALVIIHGFSGKVGVEQVEKAYNDLVNIFGEEHVLDKFDLLRNNNLYSVNDTNFTIVSRKKAKEVGLIVGEFSSVDEAIEQLLGTGSPDNYIRMKLLHLYCKSDWVCTNERLIQLKSSFGEDKVNKLAKVIYEKPRFYDNEYKYGLDLLTESYKFGEFKTNRPLSIFLLTLSQDDPDGFLRYIFAIHNNILDRENIDKELSLYFEKYGKDKVIKLVEEERTKSLHKGTMLSGITSFPEIDYKLSTPDGEIVDKIDFEKFGKFNEIESRIGYLDNTIGCADTATVYIVLESKKKYLNNTHKWNNSLTSMNHKLFDWNSLCKGKDVSTVNYLFYDKNENEIIRKSWMTKEDNWKYIHTKMDYVKNKGIDKLYRKEKL